MRRYVHQRAKVKDTTEALALMTREDQAAYVGISIRQWAEWPFSLKSARARPHQRSRRLLLGVHCRVSCVGTAGAGISFGA